MTKVTKSARLIELEQKLEKIQDIILNVMSKAINLPEQSETQNEHLKELFSMYRDVKTSISECEI